MHLFENTNSENSIEKENIASENKYLNPMECHKLRVKCVINVGTNTGPLLDDVNDDLIHINETNSNESIDSSPTFFLTHSSSNETVYETIIEEPKTYIIPNSLTLAEWSKFNISNSNALTSLDSTTKLSTSDTFEFTFAPKNENKNNLTYNIDSQNQNLSTKRVNFNFLKNKVYEDYNIRNMGVYNSILCNTMTTIVDTGDRIDSSHTKSPNAMSEISGFRHPTFKFELPTPNVLSDISGFQGSSCKNELPSTAEGDTIDSQSDFGTESQKESVQTRCNIYRRLFNFLRPKENYSSIISTYSDSSKILSQRPLERIKVQKIYSKCQRRLVEKQTPESRAAMMNHSTKVLTLFHRTLDGIEELA